MIWFENWESVFQTNNWMRRGKKLSHSHFEQSPDLNFYWYVKLSLEHIDLVWYCFRCVFFFPFAIHCRSMSFMKINKLLGWITPSSFSFKYARFLYLQHKLLLWNISDSLDSNKLVWFFSDEKKRIDDRHTRFDSVLYWNIRLECQTRHLTMSKEENKTQ